MFRHQAQLPIDIMCGSSPTEAISPTEYAAQLQTSLPRTFSHVCENQTIIYTAHNQQKEQYDQVNHSNQMT